MNHSKINKIHTISRNGSKVHFGKSILSSRYLLFGPGFLVWLFLKASLTHNLKRIDTASRMKKKEPFKYELNSLKFKRWQKSSFWKIRSDPQDIYASALDLWFGCFLRHPLPTI
jgi:hypothetical protein